MTKQLEQLFNLSGDLDDGGDAENTVTHAGEDFGSEYPTTDEIDMALDIADKIDKALPTVKGMAADDADFDEYARKAMDTYDKLVDLGMNVDDRSAGPIFAVASTMMTNAINAKTAKLDKKLKMIDLQLKKANLDLKVQLEQNKKDAAALAAKNAASVGGEVLDAASGVIVSDRNTLLKEIMAQVRDSSTK